MRQSHFQCDVPLRIQLGLTCKKAKSPALFLLSTSALEWPNMETKASEQKMVFLLDDAPLRTTKLRSERESIL